MSLLAWLGRQGARAIAALVFIGLLLPPVGEVLKPYVTEAVFLLLCISFLRVDTSALRVYLRRPLLIMLATAWTTIAVPLIYAGVCLATGFDRSSPDLFLGLMLQAIASPMMATPALAALMGLDATLVLIALVTSTALVPFTAPALAWMFLGGTLSLSPFALGLKLLVMLVGAAGVALVIRWIVGLAMIEKHRDPINGFNILILFVFVSAVMGNVAGGFFANPLQVVLITALAFVVFFAMLGATVLIFQRFGCDRALALGLMVSQRNMGLMLAATDGVLPGLSWLYFALAQFPIYLSPLMLTPLVRQTRANDGT